MTECKWQDCEKPVYRIGCCGHHYRIALRDRLVGNPRCLRCDNGASRRGLCDSCYVTARKNGDLPPLQEKPTQCIECDLPHHAKGFCRKHYLAEWRRLRREEYRDNL